MLPKSESNANAAYESINRAFRHGLDMCVGDSRLVAIGLARNYAAIDFCPGPDYQYFLVVDKNEQALSLTISVDGAIEDVESIAKKEIDSWKTRWRQRLMFDRAITEVRSRAD